MSSEPNNFLMRERLEWTVRERLERFILPGIGLVFICVPIGGCASTVYMRQQLQPYMQTTRITSEPVGAAIEIDGAYVGRSPLEVQIQRHYFQRYNEDRFRLEVSYVQPVQITAYPDYSADQNQHIQFRRIGENEPNPAILFLDMRLEPESVRQERQRREAEEAQQRKVYETLTSWIGHTKTELLEQWGPPTRILEAEEHHILAYDNSTQVAFPLIPTAHHSPSMVKTFKKYVMFWTNRGGIIEKVTWEGY